MNICLCLPSCQQMLEIVTVRLAKKTFRAEWKRKKKNAAFFLLLFSKFSSIKKSGSIWFDPILLGIKLDLTGNCFSHAKFRPN